MNNDTHCFGCRRAFESYGMTKNEAYQEGGQLFCSSDCAMESEIEAIEFNNFESLQDYD